MGLYNPFLANKHLCFQVYFSNIFRVIFQISVYLLFTILPPIYIYNYFKCYYVSKGKHMQSIYKCQQHFIVRIVKQLFLDICYFSWPIVKALSMVSCFYSICSGLIPTQTRFYIIFTIFHTHLSYNLLCLGCLHAKHFLQCWNKIIIIFWVKDIFV